MRLDTFIPRVAALAMLTLVVTAADATVEVQRMYAQGDQLVLEVVDRPDASAQVEVEIDGTTYKVPVTGLRPNQRRTLRTSIEIPCGQSTSVMARVGGSSSTETFSVPCPGGSTSGSTGTASSGSSSPTSGSGTSDSTGSSSSASDGSTTTPSTQSPTDLIEIGDLAVNPRSGQLQAQVEIHAYPPRRQAVEVLFEYPGSTEKVREFRFALNNPRTVSTRQPFPCNTTDTVTATVVSPAEWAGVSATDTLSRECSRTQGTPNLAPLSLERVELGESTAIGQTSIQVRIQVANVSEYDMPDNEQGGNWWYVRVSGLNRLEQVRRALKAGEKYSFTERVTQPCWSLERDRFGTVTVTVDDRNNIRESDENDNQKTFTIERKRCRDAG